MANFLQAQTDLLDYWNRPSSEMLTQAKREINLALKWLQRKRAFKMTERLIRATIPADSLHVNIADACDGSPRNILSVQRLASVSGTSGRVVKLHSYESIICDRRMYQRLHEPSDAEFETPSDPFGHSDHITSNEGGILFLLGANNFGIYPTNASDVYLLVHLHVWLPELSADGDTNFFLDYAYDLVLARAMITGNIYFKEDRRLSVTAEVMADEYNALVAWDNSIRAPIEQP